MISHRIQMSVSVAVAAALYGTLALAQAVEPQIVNRAPQSDEWGYHPAEGESVRVNPPSLTWIHEDAAVRYVVQIATKPDFSDAITVKDDPWPTYTHNAPLDPGDYLWRYRFVDKAGSESNWSLVRTFTISADAVDFPMPNRAEQKANIPEPHPRLFMRPEDLPRLRELAQGREKEVFEKIKKEADAYLKAGPTPEPTVMGSARDRSNLEAVKAWWPNRMQAERASNEAITLAFVYLITQDKTYGEAARKWVLALAAWDPDGPTNFGLNCEAAKIMLYRPARAYDWAWDMFTPEERAKIRAVTQRRISDAWNSGEVRKGVGHLNRPYGSHGNRTWHKIAEAGIAFYDEIAEAPQWVDFAVNKFYAAYPVWADDDGGWHEGVSYWSGYQSKAVWWLQVAKSALKIDGMKKPFFSQVGDYPMYIAPPHTPNSGMGDLSNNPPSSSVGAFMDYHIRMRGSLTGENHAGYWRWWTEASGMKGMDGVLGFLYRANLPPLPEARPASDLPQSKIFHGIGIASLHTTLLDSRDDVHFLMKSSPYGSQSHGHNPQNTFQLNAYGECLLTTCVYRDLHGSKFHYEWAHSTIAHNGVLVDGEGQEKHKVSAKGEIIAEHLTPEYDAICGDATPAYGGRLTRALRHAVLVKGKIPFVLLYDDLEAPKPVSYQFMLHAQKEFSLDESASAVSVDLPKAGVEVRYLAETPLSFRQWDGYDPAPSFGRNIPNQWHVEAGTQEKNPSIRMYTVIVPHRAGAKVLWTAERLPDGKAGVQITMEGVIHTIHFPSERGLPIVTSAPKS